MDILQSNIETIRSLCRQYHVSKLFVFGSVLTNKFDTKSDIDLIVDFENVNLLQYADNYFDLKFSLEKLFNRPVDLLEEKAIKNPYFKKAVDQKKHLIYG